MNRIVPAAEWLVSILVPFFLLMTAVRLLISPAFLQIEYNTPAFPADEFGFSYTERMQYARLAVNYLVNNAGIEFLGDQTFADGSALYNERELSHMVDVKVLVQKMILAWYGITAVLILALVVAWRTGWLAQFGQALSRGGWLTIGLIAVLLFFVAISFETLFTEFHRIFFTGGSWIFYTSDTLIRLFPIRFWRDAFIGVGGFTVTAAVLLAVFGRRIGISIRSTK